ncbi:MAG: mannose-6-phosphate isomerase, class I, partial [Leptospiraceae bacterium]|nr:mannose-6-phosphate isomerase, class I [Leptospiraceae bacterium]
MTDFIQNPAPYYVLENQVMRYAWGKTGSDTIINQLLQSAGREPVSDGPTAELWMGAHPAAPSRLRHPAEETEYRLNEVIRMYPAHFLGPRLNGRTLELPFLFKILSVNQPLSIQAHPDRRLAAVLHARSPEHYPDKNHKPELAICIRDMEALIGFRRPEQISEYFRFIPELGQLCSSGGEVYGTSIPPRPELLSKDQKRLWLKQAFTNLMRATPGEIQEAAHSHRIHLEMLRDSDTELKVEDRWFLKLMDIYGQRDAGIFAVYFLNYVSLEPQEALFLGANEPHAYLTGDIVEIMAASDNVIRAGLTSKYRDVDSLVEMLHYQYGPANLLVPRRRDAHHSSYRLDVSDFNIHRITLHGDRISKQYSQDLPSILLVLEGDLQIEVDTANHQRVAQGRTFPAGTALFVPGDLEERGLELQLSARDNCVVYQA